MSYVTRDTVDLLAQGSGGVSEARKAVESYEEKSPLYGVVQYRRKKFILKYVPDGTSRLLQGMSAMANFHSHTPRVLTCYLSTPRCSVSVHPRHLHSLRYRLLFCFSTRIVRKCSRSLHHTVFLVLTTIQNFLVLVLAPTPTQ